MGFLDYVNVELPISRNGIRLSWTLKTQVLAHICSGIGHLVVYANFGWNTTNGF